MEVKELVDFINLKVMKLHALKMLTNSRSLSNPRITYSAPTVSGKGIDKRSSTPNLYKNRTSKTFPQTQANLLKTTGAVLRGKAAENYVMRDTNRTDSKPIFGSAAPINDKRTYTTPNVQRSE